MGLTAKQQALLCRAIKIFGESAQWGQAIEECAELIVAIRHRDRERVTDEQVAEEVADVLIMAEQARQMIGPDIVDQIMQGKLVRLQRRIDHEEGRQTALERRKVEYKEDAVKKDRRQALAREQHILTEEERQAVEKNFFVSVEKLQVSNRSASRLQYAQVVYIGQLIQRTEVEMLKIKGLGRRCLGEIKYALEDFSPLFLGMRIDHQLIARLAEERREAGLPPFDTGTVS